MGQSGEKASQSSADQVVTQKSTDDEGDGGFFTGVGNFFKSIFSFLGGLFG
jgi:hypothetical protein